jgi:hypothetical protein
VTEFHISLRAADAAIRIKSADISIRELMMHAVVLRN